MLSRVIITNPQVCDKCDEAELTICVLHGAHAKRHPVQYYEEGNFLFPTSVMQREGTSISSFSSSSCGQLEISTLVYLHAGGIPHLSFSRHRPPIVVSCSTRGI